MPSPPDSQAAQLSYSPLPLSGAVVPLEYRRRSQIAPRHSIVSLGTSETSDGDTIADANKRRWAAHDDWAAHKRTIVDLYATKELEEVMQIMERDYHFFSTPKIYKTKLKEWNVGKRLNDEDMLAILELKAQRKAADKTTEFWLMGKRVSELNIRRYLKRKPQILTKFHRGQRAFPANIRVTCATPPPALSIDPVIREVGIAHETELLLTDCRDYWRTSFDSGSWILDENSVCVGSRAGKWGNEKAEDIMSKFYAAADLLSRLDFSGAFKVLDLAFRGTGELLLLDVPKFFPIFLIILTRLHVRGQLDTLNIFRKYVQGQVANLQHVNSRFRSLIQSVTGLEATRYSEIFPRLFDLMTDQSDDLYGPASCLSVDVYYIRFAGFIIRQDSESQVRSIKAELDKVSPERPRTAWVHKHERLYAWKHAQLLCDQGHYAQALAELRSLEADGELQKNDVDMYRQCQFIAAVYRKSGALMNAEVYLRRSLKVIMQGSAGPDEDSIQFGSNKLAEVLVEMGRTEEAALVREHSRNYIEAVASQAHWDYDEFQRRTAVEPVEIPSPTTTTTLALSESGYSEQG